LRTADVGWVTGHSYIVYGPCQRSDDRHTKARRIGGTDRFWKIIEEYRGSTSFIPRQQRSVHYSLGRHCHNTISHRSACSAPSANQLIQKHGCGIGKNIGGGRCPVVDTWWQTEARIDYDYLPGAIPRNRVAQ
jgi:acetyl-CoA synthetase